MTPTTQPFSKQPLRALLILNGGAAIAFLTFLGSLLRDASLDMARIGGFGFSMRSFLMGACLAVAASGATYLSNLTQSMSWRRTGYGLMILAISFGLASLVAFILGGWTAAEVFMARNLADAAPITSSVINGAYGLSHVSAVGLVFDIAGVILLAFALLAISNNQITAQAGTFYGGNRNLARALVEQRTDAYAGLPCLVFGFGLQLLGTIGWLDPNSEWWWTLLIPLAIAIALYVLWLRGSIVARHNAAVAKLAGDDNESKADSSPDTLSA